MYNSMMQAVSLYRSSVPGEKAEINKTMSGKKAPSQMHTMHNVLQIDAIWHAFGKLKNCAPLPISDENLLF